MKNAGIFLLVFTFILSFAVHAMAFEFGKLNIRGTEEGKFFTFKDSTEEDSTLYRGESKLKLNMDGNLTDNISVVLIPEIYVDSDNLASDFLDSFRERNERRYILNLEEAYLLYSRDEYNISLGKRIYSWGMADGYQPIDNLNSYEFTDVPDYRKLGVVSASFDYVWPETSISLVVIPFFTPARLPEKDSRWMVTKADSNDSLVTGAQFAVNSTIQQIRAFLASLGITIPGLDATIPNTTAELERFSSLEPRELPAEKFRNMQYGARLKTTKGGTDYALTWYDGFDNVSVIKKKVTETQVLFIPTYNKMKEIGGAVSTTQGQLEKHAEVAFHVTDGQADDDYVEYILGGSYTWDKSKLHFYCDEIKLFLEYAGEKVTNYRTNKDYIAYEGYRRPFRNSILSRLAMDIDMDNKLDVSVAYNLNDEDSYVQPKFTHKFNDSWKMVLGLDIFSGTTDSFFGKWDRNDRLFTFVTYSF